MDLISIIIPVYNVEKFLPRCLDSILIQTYSNLDIILVDDGSTDNSGMICEEYKKKDNQIRVIHQKNRGLSEARNKGIIEAKGKYLVFVDSDDYVSKKYIENLYRLIKEKKTDIGVTCAIKFYENTKFNCKEEKFVEKNTKIFNSEKALEDMLYRRNIPIYAWAKIYNKKLFEKVKFPSGELFEDLGTEYLLFHSAKTISFNPVRDYYYFQRKNSIINSDYNSKRMIQVINCEKIITFVAEYYPDIIKAAISKCFVTTVNHYLSIPMRNKFKNDRNYSKKIIKKYRSIIVCDSCNKILVRCMAALSFINVDLLKIGGRLYHFLVLKNILKIKKPI